MKKMEKMTEIIIKFCPPFVLACWIDVRVLFGMVFILLLMDNFAAIYAAWKLHTPGRKWFRHYRMFSTIEKFIAYGIALIVAWVVTQIVGLDFGLDKFVAGYIAIYESISIFGHLSRITGMTLFSDMIAWLREKAEFRRFFMSKVKKKGENND